MEISGDLISSLLQTGNVDVRGTVEHNLREILDQHVEKSANITQNYLDKFQCLQLLVNTWVGRNEQSWISKTNSDPKDVAICSGIVQLGLESLQKKENLDNDFSSMRPCLLHTFEKCFPLCGLKCQESAIELLVKSFSSELLDIQVSTLSISDQNNARYDIHTTIDLLSLIFNSDIPSPQKWLKPIYKNALKLMEVANAEIAGKIMGILMPKIIQKLDHVETAAFLEQCWESVEEIYNNLLKTSSGFIASDTPCDRPFLILCGFANWFIPVDGVHILDPPLQCRKSFWNLLQSGFSQDDSLTRKRALYILKRILDITETQQVEFRVLGSSEGELPIFQWNKDRKCILGNVWQDYILLIETLEEKQVHVIKPLMPRFAALVAHTTQPADSPVLHTSWILTLVSRICSHESAFIKRWGFLEFLKLNISTFPLIQQNGPAFLQNQLVALLAESNMYYKPPERPLGSCPPISETFVNFLPYCLDSLHTKEEKALFLGSFIHAMLNYNWSGTALVHVARALAHLKPTPVCDSAVVNDIREILQVSMSSLEIYLRGATQCFFASAVLRIIDPGKVGPAELLPLLAILRGSESLARGSVLWTEYVEWLQTVSEDHPAWNRQKITHFITQQFTKTGETLTESKSETSSVDILAVVRLCLLSLDSGILDDPSSRSQPLQTFLQPVIATLLTVNTHVYMSPAKATHSINIMVTFLKICESKLTPAGDSTSKLLKKMMSECVGQVVLYSCIKITGEAEDLHGVENVTFYMEILERLASSNFDMFASPPVKALVNQILTLHWKWAEPASPPTLRTQLQRYAGMVFLGFVARQLVTTSEAGDVDRSVRDYIVHSWRNKKPIHDFTRPALAASDGSESLRGEGNSTWGRMSAEFISGQWYCLYLHLTSSPTLPQADLEDRMVWCSEALNVTSGRNIIPVLQTLKLILPQVRGELVGETVRFAWKKVMEESRNTLSFWQCWQTFIDSIFQPELLHHSDERVTQVLSELMEAVYKDGEEKQGLVNTMVSHLCEVWMKVDYKGMTHYIDSIVSALTFGPIHDKSRKQCQESVAFLSTDEKLAVNQLKDGGAREDNRVRAMMLSMLCRLRLDQPTHQTLSTQLISTLTHRHRTINQVKTYRDFINSQAHREKHRIMVALLTLQQFISKESLEWMIEELLGLLSSENHPSVRVMIEWLLIRLILPRPALLHTILLALQKSDEKRMAYLCSLFTISTHVARSIPTDKQESVMLDLIGKLLPWCTMHHFNCRTFAQACLIMLWHTCQQKHLEVVLRTHSVIENLVQFQKNNINQSKGTQKLLDNFFFHFDPVEDYSIETLVMTLPRLTCIQDDEWIQPVVFTHVDKLWLTDPALPTLLPLHNTRHVLDTCQPGTWKIKFVDPDTFEVSEGNVQKKIIPWISMLPEQDLEPELQDELSAKQARTGGLILVTSLIDKVPNLGGLCRTSEIFGVSEFVIGNLKHTKIPEFESLSVTAHKWIPIREVRPHMLKTYMLEMKGEGYTLVGAEQTADSVSLRHYNFPRKTLLLLGNEKEGIPVDLIQLLDVCVEIPQQGLIRSLNVHVSGALLVWEYTRQWLAST